MSGKVLTRVSSNKALWLTLNRPNVGNAMDHEVYAILKEQLTSVATDDTVKCVVLTGNGSYFSTGADVATVVKQAAEGAEQVLEGIRHSAVMLTDILIDFPKPIVAAVNGPAVGWSAACLPLCDIIYVSPKATLQTPFAQLGLVTEGLSSVTFPIAFGASMASEVLYFGRRVTAQEMLESKFASRMVGGGGGDDVNKFHEDVDAIVEKACAASSAGSWIGMKSLVRTTEKREAMKAANRNEFDSLVERYKTGEVLERFKATLAALENKKKKM